LTTALRCVISVDPYLFPARGRKRINNLGVLEGRLEVDPYLFPARGRKPKLSCQRPEGAWDYFVDPYLFPARGRKRNSFVTREEVITSHVDPYLFPARGRKRRCLPASLSLNQVDPYLFPARGRKRSHRFFNGLGHRIDVDPYLFPARGRKPTTK